MESFWGTMQIELLDKQKWKTNVEQSVAMADYIVNFYNQDRGPVNRYQVTWTDKRGPGQIDLFQGVRTEATGLRSLR